MSRLPALGPRGEGWVVAQFMLLGAIAVAGWLYGGAWSGNALVGGQVVGGTLIVGGLALAFLGLRDLDRSLSPLPRPTNRAVLVSHGVYGWLRHPIYTGLIAGSVGWSLVSASAVALGMSVVLAVLLDLKSRREEAWLRERFDGYAAYAERTKRFVPGLY